MRSSIITMVLAFSQVMAAESAPQGLMGKMQRSNGVYSLHEAAAVGDNAVLQARLKEGAVVNQRDERGDTPLHFAARTNNAQAVELLLKAGADSLAKDSAGNIPSALATDEGIRAALAPYEKERALEVEAAKLIRTGAPEAAEAIGKLRYPDAQTEDGSMNLLALAIETKHEALARQLVEKGADPNASMPTGETILIMSVEYGTPELTEYLLEKGADPMHGLPNSDYTALHYAVWRGRTEQVRVLLPHYKEVNFNPGDEEQYPARMSIRTGRHGILQLFLQAGMDVNSPIFKNSPLLISAARMNDAKAVKLLLEAGADKGARNPQGKCAADYATGECAGLLK